MKGNNKCLGAVDLAPRDNHNVTLSGHCCGVPVAKTKGMDLVNLNVG